MVDVIELLRAEVADGAVVPGDQVSEALFGDEALGIAHVRPLAAVFPSSTDEVAAILRMADEHGIPVTARGSGTGLSGGAVPRADGIVVSFERMASVIEVDVDNLVAVVQPGVTLDELDRLLEPMGLVYPVFPGEYSASLGGNVATNAGGMRAVKYGVTRHQVVGLEAVLPGGEVIRTGGKYVKGSTGYDLTQLIIGSEGTLAVVTEATLRVYPRCEHQATLLAPFETLAGVTHAVPKVVASGVGPMIVEYIDLVTMSAMANDLGVELGVSDDIRERALAYLVIQLESAHEDRLEADMVALAEQVADLGAMDVFILPTGAATKLIEAREKAFWIAKGAGADDIVDVVVPRASIADFMDGVSVLASETSSWIAGCGHAGDGNVHLSVFQSDPEVRGGVMRGLFQLGMDLGGAISGEHGLGKTKKKYFNELEDPAKIALMRRIKAAFDPNGILNPDNIFETKEQA